jgi:heparinase II/III-like protein
MSLEQWRRIRERVGRMDSHEMLDRSRQEFSKRTDAVLVRFGRDFSKGLVQSEGSRLSSKRPPQFFFSPQSIGSILELIRQRLPGRADEIVREADQICRHRFDILGFRDLDFGTLINWHLDPVHGKQAPRRPFHQIRYFDFEEVGDSKIVWELNRHQHFVVLAKAFLLTRDQRYADELLQQWTHWHAENPYPIGINWAGSLEVAFRTLSWNWMYHLLEGTTALPTGFRREWLRAQALNGRHIQRYLSTYFSPNTHLLGEAVALLFLGILCPEIRAAERWKSKGWTILLQQAQRQIRPDGFHFEQATYYHVYALDFFLHAALLVSANRVSLPKVLEQTLERMLNALFLLGRAGSVPRFGDDDGGRVFDPRRNRPEHLLDPLASGAILFQRGDFKAVAGTLREEALWLLGEQGVAEWDRLDAQKSELTSAQLKSSGFFLSASQDQHSQLVIDAGPQGAQSAGHGHADALSISLIQDGRSLLADPGTFQYAGHNADRDRFRGTAMHNTLRVDDRSQADPAGPFRWHQLPGIKVEEWIPGQSFDYFSGSHDGYTRLAPPVIHRRQIICTKAGLIFVRDLAVGEGEHRIDISWHVGPELQVKGTRIFGLDAPTPRLAIVPVQSHGWSEEVHRGPWSPVYGEKRSAMVLNFGKRIQLPAEFVTILLQLDAGENVGTLVRMDENCSSVQHYSYRSESRHFDFFLAHGGAKWDCGPVTSDAAFVLMGHLGVGEEIAAFCRGSYLEADGRQVVRTRRAVTRCESILRAGRADFFCSEPDAIEGSIVTTSGVGSPEPAK